MFEDLNHTDRQPLRSCIEILAVGCLWGAELALFSPTHLTVVIAAVWIILLSGSVTVLAFKPDLKAAKFHLIAPLLALFCIIRGTLSYAGFPNYTTGKSPMCELVSRLREYTVMVAGVSTAMILIRLVSPRTPQQDPIRAERPNHLTEDDSMFLNGLRDSSNATSDLDNHGTISDVESITFRHTGPSSAYSGGSHSSEMSLPSHGHLSSPLAQDIIRLSKAAYPMDPVHDQGISTPSHLSPAQTPRGD